MAFSQPSFLVLSVEAWISLQKPPKSLILLSHAFLFHPHHFLPPFSTKVKVLLLGKYKF
ncbi:hypothetical protein SLEP1_g24059 [Rubroshorea leprosula]|uniref:Uncharacterized protein n=1 Tax=Rubroshorea leprosula TaxID=152421 RepID=A0AAV5JN40_9ROSI|nr:hypothetical protein SLEP1_g24059 [Rubroshorea leprosula]